MSLATTRATVAAALTAALTSTGYTVRASRPVPLADGTGWLVLTLADTEEITLGEICRVTYDVVFSLGSDEMVAEQEMDRIGGAVLVAMNQVGRGATLRPFQLAIDGSDLFCAVGTLITEVGTI